MNVWIPRIAKLIRRYKRMLLYCYQTEDWELFWTIKRDLQFWKKALWWERNR